MPGRHLTDHHVTWKKSDPKFLQATTVKGGPAPQATDHGADGRTARAWRAPL